MENPQIIRVINHKRGGLKLAFLKYQHTLQNISPFIVFPSRMLLGC
jgi:hypothetical protein